MTSFVEMLTLVWDPLTTPGEPRVEGLDLAAWRAIVDELMNDDATLVRLLTDSAEAVRLLLNDVAQLTGRDIESVRHDFIDRITGRSSVT